MPTVARMILTIPPWSVVEAACLKGSSIAKLGLTTELVTKDLVVSNSFAGMPEHEQPHTHSFGR